MNTTSESQEIDPLVRLARETIRTFVSSGRTPSVPDSLPAGMLEQAGVFVSIKKAGRLRGCIGTFFPTEETIAQEVIANAVKSATEDPRFPPVGVDELDALEISVDVLSAPEPCETDQLDPAKYGIIVESGWRRGLLLPDLEGVDTVDEQVSIARRKAGIGPAETVSLFRFTVERHT
jgi:AmmeMemoRadiSam system protein A